MQRGKRVVGFNDLCGTSCGIERSCTRLARLARNRGRLARRRSSVRSMSPGTLRVCVGFGRAADRCRRTGPGAPSHHTLRAAAAGLRRAVTDRTCSKAGCLQSSLCRPSRARPNLQLGGHQKGDARFFRRKLNNLGSLLVPMVLREVWLRCP